MSLNIEGHGILNLCSFQFDDVIALLKVNTVSFYSCGHIILLVDGFIPIGFRFWKSKRFFVAGYSYRAFLRIIFEYYFYQSSVCSFINKIGLLSFLTIYVCCRRTLSYRIYFSIGICNNCF